MPYGHIFFSARRALKKECDHAEDNGGDFQLRLPMKAEISR
jgi:hypothetical protein